MVNNERKREGFMGQRMVVIPKIIQEKIKKNPITSSLYITDIGYYPNAKYHYRKRSQGATEYILIYCIEGQGWIKLESTRHELIPNSYFIIPAHTAHQYGSQKKDPWSIYWIHFTGNTAQQLYHKYTIRGSSNAKHPQVVKISFEEQRITNFDGIISLLETGYSEEIIEFVNIAIWQLLSSFIYNDFFSEIKHHNNETNVDTAIKYMKENIGHSISVEEIAEHINYSTSYLYSLFKEETGYSPIRYFNHLKIQRACQYLSFTDMSIKEISYQLGFNDPFYFSRLFKKLMELSPTAYREES